ncbi:MAG: lipoate--protein ligase [Clostridia bacterium]|nr:lipoate--protein ligase [Clostridia bacterium]
MIYVKTPGKDPALHLATEYYFAAEQPLKDTVLVLWSTSPTLVVGKFQNTLEEINEEYVKEHGLYVVRRLSGGGTMYMDEGGWQFAFIKGGEARHIDFKEYITPVVFALRAMGADAYMSGRNDLMLDGRKFSGNSQYKVKGKKGGEVTVHHGTLLYNTDLSRVAAATTVDPYKITSKSIKSVRERVTNISEHLPDPPSHDEFGRLLVEALMHHKHVEYHLSEREKARIEQIANELFRDPARLYGKNPACTLKNTGRFEGGKVEALLDIKGGVITSCRLQGDFFGADVEAIEEALRGCAHRYEAVLAALQALPEGLIFKVKNQELAELICQNAG